MKSLVACSALILFLVLPAWTLGTPTVTLTSTQIWAEAEDFSQDIATFEFRFVIAAPDNGDIYLDRQYLSNNCTIWSGNVGVMSPTIACSLSPLGGLFYPDGLDYKIWAGESRAFGFKAVFVPNTTGVYSCQLDRLGWSLSQGGQVCWIDLDESFKTPYFILRGIPEPATLLLMILAVPLCRKNQLLVVLPRL